MTNATETAPTGFGHDLDGLARLTGKWPTDAVVYSLEVVNDNQVLMCGGVPTGLRKNGRPKWSAKGAVFKAVVSIEQYRTAIGAPGEPQ